MATHTTPKRRAKALAASPANKPVVVRTGPEPRVVATRKVNAKAYGVAGRWATVQVLPASNRGRNARGTAGSLRGWGIPSATKHAKRAKRQGAERMGNSPRIARTNPYPV